MRRCCMLCVATCMLCIAPCMLCVAACSHASLHVGHASLHADYASVQIMPTSPVKPGHDLLDGPPRSGRGGGKSGGNNPLRMWMYAKPQLRMEMDAKPSRKLCGDLWRYFDRGTMLRHRSGWARRPSPSSASAASPTPRSLMCSTLDSLGTQEHLRCAREACCTLG